MSVLIVDWLGRGGIAQTADVWREVGSDHGFDVRLLSRAGREVSPDIGFSTAVPGRLSQHLAGVARCVRAIRSQRPNVVVVHSWLIPALELAVFRAAHSVGARVILVAHNHRSHTSKTGSDFGLNRLFEIADSVVVHSEFVRSALQHQVGEKCVLVPHPKPLALLRDRPESTSVGLTCLQFGVGRSTKNTALIADLARSGAQGWQFVIAGTLANGVEVQPSLSVHEGFQSPGELVALVQNATAVVLPYSSASQSGAVVLARCLGAIPIASAVGGIPDQITNGVDGILVESGASVEQWTDALNQAEDVGWRRTAVVHGLQRMEREHEQFVQAVLQLMDPSKLGGVVTC